jgi:methanogenic corrinoid protein MtbC1
MPGSPLTSRVRLSERLEEVKARLAEAVTDEFLTRHPDWLARYGARAREFGIQDAGCHIDFLRGAVEAGSIEAFGQYAVWAAGVLAARGILPHYLVENLEQIEKALRTALTEEQHTSILPFLAEGKKEASFGGSKKAAEAQELTKNVYLQAILRGDRAAAEGVMEEALRSGADAVDIYLELFQTALFEVGRLWETAQISVATEHMATAITQVLMARLYTRLPRRAASQGNAVITGVQGELHQIGANMVADILDAHGWNVLFLGTNAPHEGIIEAVESHGARLVGISATMLSNVPRVRQLLGGIRERVPGVRIVVGGGAFRAVPALWRDLGADGFAPDLRATIDLVNTLLPPQQPAKRKARKRT